MKPDIWPRDEAYWVSIIIIGIALLVIAPCGVAWLLWMAWRLMAMGTVE